MKIGQCLLLHFFVWSVELLLRGTAYGEGIFSLLWVNVRVWPVNPAWSLLPV